MQYTMLQELMIRVQLNALYTDKMPLKKLKNKQTEKNYFTFRTTNAISHKAQMKIQEMAFVLLALALLAVIATIFFVKFQSEKLAEAGELAKQQTAISLLDKIASMPELSCSEGEICIDKDKALIIKNEQDKLANLFQGIKEARIKPIYPAIKPIYPAGGDIIFYQSGKANESYQTFVNLCEQKKIGLSFEWDCGMAVLIIGY